MNTLNKTFLPVTLDECHARGWDAPDFVYVCGDAYVDHPSFGLAIISRILEKAGYRVAMLCLPPWQDVSAFKQFGKPRLGFLVSAGVIDSMVNHYTVAKKRRHDDAYAPGGKGFMRPDRATIVYCNRIRQAYRDVPILIGGVEASLRRFSHYDYWDDKVRHSILVDSGATLLMYGMGETSIIECANWVADGMNPAELPKMRGICYMSKTPDPTCVQLPSHQEVSTDKRKYAEAFVIQYDEQDPIRGRRMCQQQDTDRYLIQNQPSLPLSREALDAVYDLPYTRTYHPMYKAEGGIPALQEVEFSIASTRGCFGSCNFCAITFHQGRIIQSRSPESILREGKLLTQLPNFKGYIHDVGGPTANFRYPSCDRQKTEGVCPRRKCLAPTPCKNLKVDHTEYAHLLREIEKIDGVKKVFVRSGIRFDYLMYDPDRTFFRQLVTHHVSGQLKVAPEHCSDHALTMMGKPCIAVFEAFRDAYFSYCKEAGLEQYLVPYLMSSHPGTTMEDAVTMALWLKKWGYSPEQVQDFYPTPGTISTVMYYTGIHPMTGKSVYVTTDYHEKQLQRALLQYARPENRNLVREALRKAGREDLIGTGPECLVRPAFGQEEPSAPYSDRRKANLTKTRKNTKNSSHKEKKTPSRAQSGDKKKSKLERIFGDDAVRILREADRMKRGEGSHSESGASASGKKDTRTPRTQKGGRDGSFAPAKKEKNGKKNTKR